MQLDLFLEQKLTLRHLHRLYNSSPGTEELLELLDTNAIVASDNYELPKAKTEPDTQDDESSIQEDIFKRMKIKKKKRKSHGVIYMRHIALYLRKIFGVVYLPQYMLDTIVSFDVLYLFNNGISLHPH